MRRSQLFKPDKLLLESATNLKPKAFKWWGSWTSLALDSHRFWIFPFGCSGTVKVYDKSARYREYEEAWELLEK